MCWIIRLLFLNFKEIKDKYSIFNTSKSGRANNLKSDGSPEEGIKIGKWCEEEEVKKKLEQQC